jgi:hypothetical protein
MKKRIFFQLSLIITLGLNLSSVHAYNNCKYLKLNGCKECDERMTLDNCTNFCKEQRKTCDGTAYACCLSCLTGSVAFRMTPSTVGKSKMALDSCQQ